MTVKAALKAVRSRPEGGLHSHDPHRDLSAKGGIIFIEPQAEVNHNIILGLELT